MIKYFFFIVDYEPESPNYKKPRSVHRLRRDDGGLHTERWNGKEWVMNRYLISYSGIGGDNPYEQTSEEEAMKFLAAHTDKEKGG